MTTFNPGDWWPRPEWPGRGGGSRRPEQHNQEVARRWGASVAFCLCFASLVPAELFLSAFAALLMVAAVAAATFACIEQEHPFAPHLTAWDEAALSLASSLGLLVWLG